MQNISSCDFFQHTHFNRDTKNQLWMSIIADSHDSVCNCWHPFAHLLANIFPPGHKDRDLTINQILQRDFSEKCHSGGDAAEGTGMEPSGTGEDIKPDPEERGEDFPEEEKEGLLAAAATKEKER